MHRQRHHYFDISHYRAPYKNAVLSGYGQNDAETPRPVGGQSIFENVPTDEEWDEMLDRAREEAAELLSQAKSSEEVQAIQEAFEEVKETAAVQKASNAIAAAKDTVAASSALTWGLWGLAGYGLYRFIKGSSGRVSQPSFTANRRR